MSKGPSKENGALVRPLQVAHVFHHAHAAGREPAALLAEPITFFWRNTSTSPAQRLGVARRLHIGLATCQRGVQMGARPFDGAAGAGAGAGLEGHGENLMEPSVQVRKRATKRATARL